MSHDYLTNLKSSHCLGNLLCASADSADEIFILTIILGQIKIVQLQSENKPTLVKMNILTLCLEFLRTLVMSYD